MSTLTPEQQLEIQQECERVQLARRQECAKMKAATPSGRNEMSATISLVRDLDTYLASMERRMAVEGNVAYASSLDLRHVAVERFGALLANLNEAKAEAAAKAEENAST